MQSDIQPEGYQISWQIAMLHHSRVRRSSVDSITEWKWKELFIERNSWLQWYPQSVQQQLWPDCQGPFYCTLRTICRQFTVKTSGEALKESNGLEKYLYPVICSPSQKMLKLFSPMEDSMPARQLGNMKFQCSRARRRSRPQTSLGAMLKKRSSCWSIGRISKNLSV